MEPQRTNRLAVRAWTGLVLRMTAFALALLVPAGTWRWWEAWVVVGLWLAFAAAMVTYLLRHDRDLLAERLKFTRAQPRQKSWDRMLMAIAFVVGIALYVVPGLDVVRFGWSTPLPLWLKLIAIIVHIPGFVFIGWVMHTNTFLSRVVKIDTDRGHRVITTGPYALVRHPMYLAVIVLVFAMPLVLGSRYGLAPALAMAALIVVRTALEDRTLMQELSGYTDYARTTRYRLVPGVW